MTWIVTRDRKPKSPILPDEYSAEKWLLKHQGMSNDWAKNYEGWAVVETAKIRFHAVSPNGRNTYSYGDDCSDCRLKGTDPGAPPVPCVDPYAHAAVTVKNWQANGLTNVSVVSEEIKP